MSLRARTPALSQNLPVLLSNGSADAHSAFAALSAAGAGIFPGVTSPSPAFIRAVSLEHGYVRAEANRTAFAMEAVRSADGEVVDSFVLTK